MLWFDFQQTNGEGKLTGEKKHKKRRQNNAESSLTSWPEKMGRKLSFTQNFAKESHQSGKPAPISHTSQSGNPAHNSNKFAPQLINST